MVTVIIVYCMKAIVASAADPYTINWPMLTHLGGMVFPIRLPKFFFQGLCCINIRDLGEQLRHLVASKTLVEKNARVFEPRSEPGRFTTTACTLSRHLSLGIPNIETSRTSSI